MATSDDLDVGPDDLPDRLTRHVYELNMLLRAGRLYGYEITLDMVDRHTGTDVIVLVRKVGT